MAKKSSIIKNNNRKNLSKRYGEKRKKYLIVSKDESIRFEERLIAQIKLSEMPRDTSRIRYRNRCALSGRPRGNLRKFGLSRIAVRELASWGQIPGLIKSSW
jgi:small subunit ribosomal protein S14